jgi:hypothetical protein
MTFSTHVFSAKELGREDQGQNREAEEEEANRCLGGRR